MEIVGNIAIGLVLVGAVYLSTIRTLRRAVESAASPALSALLGRTFLVSLCLAMLAGAWSLEWNWGGTNVPPTWVLGLTVATISMRLLLVVLVFAVLTVVLMAVFGRGLSRTPVCGKCGYDLRGQVDEIRCPECGEKFAGGACKTSCDRA